jgi:cytochrome c biogenesis protein CcmG, thiol:disulfide interchange protein DsbE
VRAVTGVLLGLAVGLVVLAVVAAERPSSQSPPSYSPSQLAAGSVAPSFSIPRLGGGAPVSLAAYKGKPLVINFFGSYCTYCKQDLQAFAIASRRLAGKVSVVAVDASDPDPAKARQELLAAGDDYPAGADPNGSMTTQYFVTGLPWTVFVDAAGRVVQVIPGPPSASEIEQDATIAEAG